MLRREEEERKTGEARLVGARLVSQSTDRVVQSTRINKGTARVVQSTRINKGTYRVGQEAATETAQRKRDRKKIYGNKTCRWY